MAEPKPSAEATVAESSSSLTKQQQPPQHQQAPSHGRRQSTLDREALAKAQKEKKRKYILQEVVETEEEYVRDLQALMTVWQPAASASGVFSAQESQSLFGTIPQLGTLAEVLAKDLRDALGKPLEEQKVGAAFLKKIPFFRLYIEYCANRTQATEILRKAVTHPKWQTFRDQMRAEPLTKMQDLSGFLIKPTQRVTKYPLFLKDLIKNTDPSHADYKALVEASETMMKVLAEVNEKTRQEESFTALTRMQPLINWRGPICELIASKCILMKMGNVAVNVASPGAQSQKGNFLLLLNRLLLVLNECDGMYGEIATIKVQDLIVPEELPRRASKQVLDLVLKVKGENLVVTLHATDILDYRNWNTALKDTYELLQAQPSKVPFVMKDAVGSPVTNHPLQVNDKAEIYRLQEELKELQRKSEAEVGSLKRQLSQATSKSHKRKQHIADAEAKNAQLKEELAKKDAEIKHLREGSVKSKADVNGFSEQLMELLDCWVNLKPAPNGTPQLVSLLIESESLSEKMKPERAPRCLLLLSILSRTPCLDLKQSLYWLSTLWHLALLFTEGKIRNESPPIKKLVSKNLFLGEHRDQPLEQSLTFEIRVLLWKAFCNLIEVVRRLVQPVLVPSISNLQLVGVTDTILLEKKHQFPVALKEVLLDASQFLEKSKVDQVVISQYTTQALYYVNGVIVNFLLSSPEICTCCMGLQVKLWLSILESWTHTGKITLGAFSKLDQLKQLATLLAMMDSTLLRDGPSIRALFPLLNEKQVALITKGFHPDQYQSKPIDHETISQVVARGEQCTASAFIDCDSIL